MTGHLYIVDGDITKLSCDAWMLPTDNRFKITDSFAAAAGLNEAGFLQQPVWKEGESFRQLNRRRNRGEPQIWLGKIGGSEDTPAGKFAQLADEFIGTAAAAVESTARGGRQLPLFAVNLVGSGHGGGARRKGELCRALVPTLGDAAVKNGVDVALVTWGRAAYSAAQRIRRTLWKVQTQHGQETRGGRSDLVRGSCS